MTLLVATQDPNAPAETYVRQHMREIAPNRTVGLGFTVSGKAPTDLPFLSVMLPNNVFSRKLYLLHGRMRHGFAGAPVGRQRAKIIDFLRMHDVTVVLAEFGPTGAALREVCQAEGIPLIVNFHGYDATVMPKRADIRAAYQRLSQDAAGFICGSRCFSETVAAAGISKEKIVVIPCGVRTDTFHSDAERDGRRLIAVGRLTPKKAPLVMLEAFYIARKSVPDLKLDVIGDGPLMKSCIDFVIENQLEGCVTLHGACHHDTVREMMASADIFVQHSIIAPNGDTESQGISLAEAMAAALPTVVTDHNGFSEVVLQGETGFLVPEGDVVAMGERIVALAEDAGLRWKMGKAAQSRARKTFDAKVTSALARDYLLSFAAI